MAKFLFVLALLALAVAAKATSSKSVVCNKCIQSIEKLKSDLTAPELGERAKILLYFVCSLQPSKEKQCTQKIDAEVKDLQANISSALGKPSDICAEIRMCPKKSDLRSLLLGENDMNETPCMQCVDGISYMKKRVFGRHGIVQQINTFMYEKICKHLPVLKLRNACVDVVKRSVNVLFAPIKYEIHDPRKACEKAGVCPESFVLTLAKDCSDCVKSMTELEQNIFGPGGVEDQVKQKAEAELCGNIPDFLKKPCTVGVDDAVDLMFAGIRKEFDNPQKQCEISGACNKTTFLTGVKLPSCCHTCRNITGRILSELKNPKLHSRLDFIASLPCYFRVDKHACQVPRIARVESLLNNLTHTVQSLSICKLCCRHNVTEVQLQNESKISANPLQCALCKLIGNVINSALQNGMNPAEIEEQAIQSCNAMPHHIRERCLENMKQFDEMVQTLKTNGGNVPAACVVVGQCNGQAEVELVKEFDLKNPLDCINCKLIANIIRQAILAGRTKEQIVNNCLTFCSKLVPRIVSDSCTNFVNEQLDQFIDIVKKNNGNAELACKEFGKCKRSATEIVLKKPRDDCTKCKSEAAVLANELKSGKRKSVIAYEAYQACNKLSQKQRVKCNKKVAENTIPLLDALESHKNDPKVACQVVKRCTADVAENTELTSNPVGCIVCKIVANLVEQRLIRGATRESIDNDVRSTCLSLLRPLQKPCISLLADLNQVISALHNSHGDASGACTTLRKCGSKIDAVAEFLKLTTIDSCEFCEEQACILSSRLLLGDTKGIIVDEWTDVCDTLENDSRAACLSTVEKQIAPLIDALEKNEQDPKSACKAVKRCTSLPVVEAIPVDDCKVCTTQGNYLIIDIEFGQSKKTIIKNWTDYCNTLDDKDARAPCLAGIDKQISPLYDAVERNHLNATAACAEVKRCPASEVVVAVKEDNACAFCQDQAGILSARMDNGDTKGMILAAWSDVCSTLDETVRPACLATTNTQISPLLDALDKDDSNFKAACAAVKRCDATSDETTLVEKLSANPVSCAVCKIVANGVEQLLIQGNDRADIDETMRDTCAVLLRPLRKECINLLADINQVMSALSVAHGDASKACESLNKCR